MNQREIFNERVLADATSISEYHSSVLLRNSNQLSATAYRLRTDGQLIIFRALYYCVCGLIAAIFFLTARIAMDRTVNSIGVPVILQDCGKEYLCVGQEADGCGLEYHCALPHLVALPRHDIN